LQSILLLIILLEAFHSKQIKQYAGYWSKPMARTTKAYSHLLLELANLQDSGLRRFRRKFPLPSECWSDSDLLQFQEELRDIWTGQTTIKKKESILSRWLALRPFGFAGMNYSAWQVSWRGGWFIPEADNLPGRLLYSVLANRHYLTVCRNPNCPARYFIAKRRDQKVCEQGPCKEYVQREWAMNWWNQEGKQRREKRMKAARANKTHKKR
jgi:hypothetical protein